jgi:hypothetical protein
MEVLVDGGVRKPPPGPRIEADPHSNLLLLLSREDSTLNSYRWISRDSGIVQVPVERAMELVLEKGLLESR